VRDENGGGADPGYSSSTYSRHPSDRGEEQDDSESSMKNKLVRFIATFWCTTAASRLW
jgi:hypothetical protein